MRSLTESSRRGVAVWSATVLILLGMAGWLAIEGSSGQSDGGAGGASGDTAGNIYSVQASSALTRSVAAADFVAEVTIDMVGDPRYNTLSGEYPYVHYSTPQLEPLGSEYSVYRAVTATVVRSYKDESPVELEAVIIGETVDLVEPTSFFTVGQSAMIFADLDAPGSEPAEQYTAGLAEAITLGGRRAARVLAFEGWRYGGSTAEELRGLEMSVSELRQTVAALTAP